MTTPSAGVRVSIHEPGTTSFPEEQGQESSYQSRPLTPGRPVCTSLIKDLMPELEHQQLLQFGRMKFSEQNFHITTKTVAKWLTIKKLMINYGIIMECKYRTRSYYLGPFLEIAFEVYSLIRSGSKLLSLLMVKRYGNGITGQIKVKYILGRLLLSTV